MALAKHIGGLPALDRELADADKAEVETAGGRSAYVTVAAMREALLQATAAGLEILRADRATQVALLGGGGLGTGLPPLALGGIPYGDSDGVLQVISTAAGRELLALTRDEQLRLFGEYPPRYARSTPTLIGPASPVTAKVGLPLRAYYELQSHLLGEWDAPNLPGSASLSPLAPNRASLLWVPDPDDIGEHIATITIATKFDTYTSEITINVT